MLRMDTTFFLTVRVRKFLTYNIYIYIYIYIYFNYKLLEQETLKSRKIPQGVSDPAPHFTDCKSKAQKG